MRILVTGATGFVGARLVRRLAAADAACVVLSRNPARAKQALPEAAAHHAWEPLAGPPPREAVTGVDAVVHLAGEPVVGRWTARKRRAIRESRVLGTQHLVEALRASDAPPRALVSASAIGFYGDRGDVEVSEAAQPGHDFLAEVCQAWEEAAELASPLGVRVVRLRIGLVLEPTGGALGAMLTPFRLGLGGPLGSGRQWWSWIHQGDLLRLIEHALRHDELRGPVNATAPAPTRQAEFARTLAAALGRWSLLPAPSPALRLALGGFADELLSSRRVLPRAAEAAGFAFEFPTLEAALRDLIASAR